MNANPSRKHLVLLGTGRAHLHVLKSLARQGTGGSVVTLVAPYPYYVEPALLPGYVAGDYTLQDIRVPLARLIEASGVGFVSAHVHSLDPAGRRVQLSSGDALPYDVLSIDAEPAFDRDRVEVQIPGARHNALFTRPLENFVQLWPQLQALARARGLQVGVIGSDLFAAELAMAAAQILAAPHGSRVTLLAGDTPLLHGQPAVLQRRVLGRLKALNVNLLQDRCVNIDGRALQLASGASLMCDAPIIASGADLPGWLRQSGIQVDEAGKPVVNERLQSESHRQVFVVPPGVPGEVGVALEANLRTAISGGAFRKVPVNLSRLKVVTCGGRHAIAVWGPLGLEGREVWNWNDRRNRRQLAALFSS
ncbi:MAG: FAD-dependent oxidoreductase [Burkholderiaceae bacterium]|jgi:NADH dehydrogenase FAD-containing subunit|nr:FAD-dependent oxidoreductase [Burkholderiaceae bacterium]